MTARTAIPGLARLECRAAAASLLALHALLLAGPAADDGPANAAGHLWRRDHEHFSKRVLDVRVNGAPHAADLRQARSATWRLRWLLRLPPLRRCLLLPREGTHCLKLRLARRGGTVTQRRHIGDQARRRAGRAEGRDASTAVITAVGSARSAAAVTCADFYYFCLRNARHRRSLAASLARRDAGQQLGNRRAAARLLCSLRLLLLPDAHAANCSCCFISLDPVVLPTLQEVKEA